MPALEYKADKTEIRNPFPNENEAVFLFPCPSLVYTTPRTLFCPHSTPVRKD